MPVYTLYVFDRKGTNLYYGDWGRTRAPSNSNLEQEAKLLYGLLYSLGGFMRQISPSDSGDFRVLKTSAYKLHYYGTLSGLRFALFTSPEVDDQRETLEHIFGDIYVPFVAMNPLAERGEPIHNDAFITALDDYVTSLPCFAGPSSS